MRRGSGRSAVLAPELDLALVWSYPTFFFFPLGCLWEVGIYFFSSSKLVLYNLSRPLLMWKKEGRGVKTATRGGLCRTESQNASLPLFLPFPAPPGYSSSHELLKIEALLTATGHSWKSHFEAVNDRFSRTLVRSSIVNPHIWTSNLP